jgi:hypothetical protein
MAKLGMVPHLPPCPPLLGFSTLVELIRFRFFLPSDLLEACHPWTSVLRFPTTLQATRASCLSLAGHGVPGDRHSTHRLNEKKRASERRSPNSLRLDYLLQRSISPPLFFILTFFLSYVYALSCLVFCGACTQWTSDGFLASSVCHCRGECGVLAAHLLLTHDTQLSIHSGIMPLSKVKGSRGGWS